MASQHTLSQVKLVAGTVLVCVGLTMLAGHQNESLSLISLLAKVAWRAAGLLPTIVTAGWPILQGHAPDLHGTLFCPIQLLVFGWPFLRFVTGVA